MTLLPLHTLSGIKMPDMGVIKQVSCAKAIPQACQPCHAPQLLPVHAHGYF